MRFQYSIHKYRRRAINVADKVSPTVWSDEGVSYYPDLTFPYNLLATPTACSRAGCHVQRISIRLCLKPKRHASNAQCIYSLLYSKRLGYCLRLDLTNFTPKVHAYTSYFKWNDSTTLHMRFHTKQAWTSEHKHIGTEPTRAHNNAEPPIRRER